MVNLGEINFGANLPFVLIAGPCVVENREVTFSTAEKIIEISSDLKIPTVFKSSFKKANRTSIKSFSGIDFYEASSILEEVKNNLNVSILTDVHSPHDVERVSSFVDILQIPAFLCRQTDLLLAAGKSGKIVNVKKGQFLAPDDMRHVIEKIESQAAEGHKLSITVIDNGQGIPEEHIAHIFNRFYQAGSSYALDQQGTGIGLALVKELVGLHHGEINVESVPGKHTSFKLIIPFGLENKYSVEKNKNVLLIQEEEVRYFGGGRRSAWRKRWRTQERRLLKVVSQHHFSTPADLARLIPETLPDLFTTADLALALGDHRRVAQQMAYCLREISLIKQIDRQRQGILYQRA